MIKNCLLYPKCVIDYTLGNNYESISIKEMLNNYDYRFHRFYATIGCYIESPENLIKLHGWVAKSESAILLTPRNLTTELMNHFLNESTKEFKELAAIVKKIANVCAELGPN